ncbi:MAG: hypothetical protein ACOYMN_15205 [Roseimicrobium sp.]
MTNINTLREKMSATVAALENKSISAEEAMAISRAAAVVIGSLRVELQYRQMRAEKPEIEFMDSHNTQGQPPRLSGLAEPPC